MSAQLEMANELKAMYLELFPNSFARVSRACLGDSFFLDTYLGNKETWFNGIHDNDQSRCIYRIDFENDSFNIACLGISLYVNPKDKMFAMSREKMRFVRKHGDKSKVLLDMKKHFVKYREFVNSHKENIYNVQKLIDANIL